MQTNESGCGDVNTAGYYETSSVRHRLRAKALSKADMELELCRALGYISSLERQLDEVRRWHKDLDDILTEKEIK